MVVAAAAELAALEEEEVVVVVGEAVVEEVVLAVDSQHRMPRLLEAVVGSGRETAWLCGFVV